MTFTFDESRFQSLWRSAEETLQLRNRLAEVLKSRDVSSFDGLGHLLDAVLPDDPSNLARIAATLRLPAGHLKRLRNSELDPLVLPLEAIALLGRVIGLTPDILAHLMQRDHARFAPMAWGVTARGGTTEDPAETLRALRAFWDRFAEDEATDL